MSSDSPVKPDKQEIASAQPDEAVTPSLASREPAFQSQAREAMKSSHRETLKPIASVLALAYLIFAIFEFQFRDPEIVWLMVWSDLSLSFAFAAFRVSLIRFSVPPGSGHKVGSILLLLILAKNLLNLFVLQTPEPNVFHCVLILAIGFLYIEFGWYLFALSLTVGSWLAVAPSVLPESTFQNFGFAMPGVVVASMIIQRTRAFVVKSLEEVHLRDIRRQAQLEQTLRESEMEIERRRLIESELRESERRFRLVAENATDVIWTTDLAFQTTYVSPSVEQMRGYTVEEALGQRMDEIVTPESMQIMARTIQEELKAGTDPESPTRSMELEVRCKDGSTVMTETVSKFLLDEDENHIGYVGVSRDISERVRAEEELRKSEALFRQLTEDITDTVWIADLSLRFVYASPSIERLRGYTVEEVLQQRLHEMIAPSSLQGLMKTVEEDLKAEANRSGAMTRPRILEIELVRKDGSTVLTETSSRFLYDADGKHTGYLGVTRDISGRLRVEEELREKATILDQIRDCVIATDMDGRITSWNQGATRIFGYTAEESIGQYATFLYEKEGARELGRRIGRILKTGQAEEWTAVANAKDGSEVWIQLKISCLKNSDGSLRGLIGFSVDITEQKRAEEERQRLETQLRQSQKMEAIGTLAGGVAHDFNNLLTGILGYSNLLKLESQPGEKVYQGADVIERAAERASQLTKQLLGFARKGKWQNVELDLNETIQEVFTLLNRTIDKNIRITQRPAAGGAFVKGDPDQLQQVVLNLAVNARDAMPEGGELTLGTDKVEIDEKYCESHPDAIAGSFVCLSVSDTGVGISSEVRDRIFEPFFTTKGEGKGTGMGLAMAYGTVHNHGGFIEFESKKNAGTAFRLYLPNHQKTENLRDVQNKGDIVEGSGRILLVDDEPVVRQLGGELLRKLGYEVVEAVDGQRAVDAYKDSDAKFDLVIIDMIMPGMGGRECFHALKAIDEQINAVLSSGYAQDHAVQEILNEGMRGFVQKPYRITELSQIIASALRGESGGL